MQNLPEPPLTNENQNIAFSTYSSIEIILNTYQIFISNFIKYFIATLMFLFPYGFYAFSLAILLGFNVYIPITILFAIIIFPIIVTLSIYPYIAMFKMTSDILQGKSPSLIKKIGEIEITDIWKFIVTYIVVNIAIIIPSALLALPAFYMIANKFSLILVFPYIILLLLVIGFFITFYYLALPVALFEKKWYFESLTRSNELGKRYRLRNIWIIILFTVINFFISFFLAIPFVIMKTPETARLILSIPFISISAISHVLFYSDMIARERNS